MALSELCEAYYAPVVAFLRRDGQGEDAARERAHAFFAKVLAGGLGSPDPARGRWLVVEDGGEIAAALMLTYEWSDWRGGFFWWIQNVYVAPGHRRSGHYRRLHDHVRATAARDPGVCGLRLYVEHANEKAQATYKAMGMEITHYHVFEELTREAPWT